MKYKNIFTRTKIVYKNFIIRYEKSLFCPHKIIQIQKSRKGVPLFLAKKQALAESLNLDCSNHQ